MGSFLFFPDHTSHISHLTSHIFSLLCSSMMVATITKLLPSSLILAAHSTIGFTPGLIAPSCTHSTHQQAHSRHQKWTLNGLVNVNDYFASFSNNNNEANESNDDASSSNNDKEKNKGKYIGHGSIGGDGGEGGLFNTNNYFNAFGDDASEADEDDAQLDEKATDNMNERPARQQNDQPMVRMTHEEIVAYNNARLCPKSFLTQRAIQSFVYLLEECRDPHSGKVSRHGCVHTIISFFLF